MKTVSKTHISVKSYGQNEPWIKIMAISFVFGADFGEIRGFLRQRFPLEFRGHIYVLESGGQKEWEWIGS